MQVHLYKIVDKEGIELYQFLNEETWYPISKGGADTIDIVEHQLTIYAHDASNYDGAFFDSDKSIELLACDVPLEEAWSIYQMNQLLDI